MVLIFVLIQGMIRLQGQTFLPSKEFTDSILISEVGLNVDSLVIKYKKSAIENGDVFSIKRVAYFYDKTSFLKDKRIPSDYNDTACIKWYLMLIEKDKSNFLPKYNYALFLDKMGKNSEALYWFKEVYAVRPERSILFLYEYSLKGIGCKKDPKKAKSFLIQAEHIAKYGSYEHSSNLKKQLAFGYKNGFYGLKVSKNKAAYWNALDKLSTPAELKF
jgi:hypothetical protein